MPNQHPELNPPKPCSDTAKCPKLNPLITKNAKSKSLYSATLYESRCVYVYTDMYAYYPLDLCASIEFNGERERERERERESERKLVYCSFSFKGKLEAPGLLRPSRNSYPKFQRNLEHT